MTAIAVDAAQLPSAGSVAAAAAVLSGGRRARTAARRGRQRRRSGHGHGSSSPRLAPTSRDRLPPPPSLIRPQHSASREVGLHG